MVSSRLHKLVPVRCSTTMIIESSSSLKLINGRKASEAFSADCSVCLWMMATKEQYVAKAFNLSICSWMYTSGQCMGRHLVDSHIRQCHTLCRCTERAAIMPSGGKRRQDASQDNLLVVGPTLRVQLKRKWRNALRSNEACVVTSTRAIGVAADSK